MRYIPTAPTISSRVRYLSCGEASVLAADGEGEADEGGDEDEEFGVLCEAAVVAVDGEGHDGAGGG